MPYPYNEKLYAIIRDQEFKNIEGLIALIVKEHNNQLKKWGVQDVSPFEWLAYLTEETGELSKAIIEESSPSGHAIDVITEAIQVATLALKIAEMYYHYRIDVEESLEDII